MAFNVHVAFCSMKISLKLLQSYSKIDYRLYAFIKKSYGSEHPLNRYQWRKMKRNGQLSEEMMHKEEVIQNYMKTRLNRVYEKEPVYSVRRQGPPGGI